MMYEHRRGVFRTTPCIALRAIWLWLKCVLGWKPHQVTQSLSDLLERNQFFMAV